MALRRSPGLARGSHLPDVREMQCGAADRLLAECTTPLHTISTFQGTAPSSELPPLRRGALSPPRQAHASLAASLSLHRPFDSLSALGPIPSHLPALSSFRLDRNPKHTNICNPAAHTVPSNLAENMILCLA